MQGQFDVIVEARTADRVVGRASRFGFELPWTALRQGSNWIVNVPRGHSLGPDGRGAFEVVTQDDWLRFEAVVRAALVGRDE